MRTVPLTELDITDEVRRAEAGEEIVITRDGRPVARILPLALDREPSRRRDLVHQGLLRPREDRRPWTEIRSSLLTLPRVPDCSGRSLAALEEDRAER